MVDYSKLSTEDLINLRNGNYSNVSDEGLLLLRENQQPQKKQNKGIDITPSGLAKKAGVAISTPIRQLRYGESKDEARSNAEALINNAFKNNMAVQGLGFASDITPYFTMPQLNAVKGVGLGAKAANLGLTGAYQGGIAGGLESLKQEGDLSGVGSGALVGGGVGAGLPLGIPAIKALGNTPVGKFGKRVFDGTVQGLLESFGMGKEAVERLATSTRGTNLSKNADYFGGEEFVNSVANRFKNGVDNFKKKEIESFSKARNNLLEKNQNTEINLKDFVDNTKQHLKARGLINNLEEITPAGRKANGLASFIEDLNYYNGNFDVNDIQRLKTDILDDIIDYRPEAGKNLNSATRGLQNIAKESRKNINELLNTKLGEEYGAANSRLSEVLEMLDEVPETKDLINSQNIDTLAGKLKKVGTTRQEAQKQIQNLENYMKESGINISDTTLVDDILDYNAAKNIKERIRTGLGSDLKNATRRSLIQPVTEFYIDRVLPTIPKIKQTAQNIGNFNQRLLPPVMAQNPLLYGQVEYNEQY